MKKYDILLFDADGTLLDFDRSEHEAMAKVFARHGYPLSEETLQLYRSINSRLWKEYEQDKILKPVIHMTRFQELFRQLGIEGDGVAVNREYLDALSEGSWMMEGALDVCRALAARFRLYVVTNGVSYVQRRRMHDSGLEVFFEDLFISEEIGVQKPRQEFFAHAAEKIPGFCREKTLIIGDSPTSDIGGGQAFGLNTCWYNPSGRELPGLAPTYEIRRLHDLLPLVGLCD